MCLLLVLLHNNLIFPVTEVLTTLVGFKFYRSQQA